MKAWIFLGLISFSAFGDSSLTLSTYETYKGNFQLLTSDLGKLEVLTQKNPSPLRTQMLKDMTYFKEQYDHVAHPLHLDDLYQDAKKNGWMNLQKMTKTLVPTCEVSESFNIALCKNGMEEMKTFALNSKLSSDNKDSITSFIDDYVAQVQALYTLSPDFVANFDKTATALTDDVTAAPVKKVTPIASSVSQFEAEIAQLPEEESGAIKVFDDVRGSGLFYAGVLIALFGVAFGVQSYKKKKSEGVIKDFYTKIFTLSKKANIQVKVFGKLTKNEVKIIEKIQMSFLNSLYLSRAVAPKTEVRFKNKKHDLSIELNFPTSRSIQNVMEIGKENAFKESVEKLQATIEADGGEVVFSNRFNAFGEIIQSALIIHLPKA